MLEINLANSMQDLHTKNWKTLLKKMDTICINEALSCVHDSDDGSVVQMWITTQLWVGLHDHYCPALGRPCWLSTSLLEPPVCIGEMQLQCDMEEFSSSFSAWHSRFPLYLMAMSFSRILCCSFIECIAFNIYINLVCSIHMHFLFIFVVIWMF